MSDPQKPKVQDDLLDTNWIEQGFQSLLENYKVEKEAHKKKMREQGTFLQKLHLSNQNLQKRVDDQTISVSMMENVVQNLKAENQQSQSQLSNYKKELAETKEAKKKIEAELSKLKESIKEKQASDEVKEKEAEALSLKLSLIKSIVEDQSKIIVADGNEDTHSVGVPQGAAVKLLVTSSSSLSPVQYKNKRKSHDESAAKSKLKKKTYEKTTKD